jgi:hypothetical protein
MCITLHTYASTTANKQQAYMTVHKGCHNNSSTNKQNHNVSTWKREGPAVFVTEELAIYNQN